MPWSRYRCLPLEKSCLLKQFNSCIREMQLRIPSQNLQLSLHAYRDVHSKLSKPIQSHNHANHQQSCHCYHINQKQTFHACHNEHNDESKNTTLLCLHSGPRNNTSPTSRMTASQSPSACWHHTGSTICQCLMIVNRH